nr:hypothetical protein [uncultured Cetobacterium sp.]
MINNRINERVQKLIEVSGTLDKRAYFTVSAHGDVVRKKMNMSLAAMVFCKNEELFLQTLAEESDKRETQKEKDISRMSSLNMENLIENLPKLIIKGELEFAKKYAKELALRDKDEFLKVLFNISLMDNLEFQKPLMALAMKEILENYGWNDKIGYLVISYFTKQRYDLSDLEKAGRVDKNSLEIRENSLKLQAYKKVLMSYNYKNEEKYADILKKAQENLKEENISEVEKEILNSII